MRIAFTIDALNDLDVLAVDVQNAYLNTPMKQHCYTTAGLEWGMSNLEQPILIIHAIYILKSSAAGWREHISLTLHDMGFKSCQADPNMWLKPNIYLTDGFEYCKYVLIYVNDLLCILHDPKTIMDTLLCSYMLKSGSVKEPTEYLGLEIQKYHILGNTDLNKKECWAMSSDKYVKHAIADVELELAQNDQCLQMKVHTPLSNGYHPELDSSPELNAQHANFYQGLISMLQWIVELGRIDILVTVAHMS